MSSSKDDTALWLHNKLGSSTHLWSFSPTVVSQYSLEKLASIRDCFVTLDSLVKIKFFLSLFYIPKRHFEEVNIRQKCGVLSYAGIILKKFMLQIYNSVSIQSVSMFKFQLWHRLRFRVAPRGSKSKKLITSEPEHIVKI